MTGLNPTWLIVVSFGLALIPLLVCAGTSYIKISVVLGLLRGGFGTQGVPGAMIISSMAMALSLYIMGPTLEASIGAAEAIPFGSFAADPSVRRLAQLRPLVEPWRTFMLAHAGKRELLAVSELERREDIATAGATAVATPDDGTCWRAALLAFVLTELRQAFSMGFVLLLPFLVIDIAVANILAGLGMFMLSPTLISLPLKLLLFVACDGWMILSRSLIFSYQ